MKLEKGSFLPTGATVIVVLNDDTIAPNRIVFWVDGTNKSHGYDDGTRQVAAYGNGVSTKNDRSIYVHNGSSALISGRVTNYDIGEFTVSFDSYAAESINFLAIED